MPEAGETSTSAVRASATGVFPLGLWPANVAGKWPSASAFTREGTEQLTCGFGRKKAAEQLCLPWSVLPEFACLFFCLFVFSCSYFFGLKRLGSGSDIFWPQFSSIKNVCLAYMSAISNRRVVPEWEYWCLVFVFFSLSARLGYLLSCCAAWSFNSKECSLQMNQQVLGTQLLWCTSRLEACVKIRMPCQQHSPGSHVMACAEDIFPISPFRRATMFCSWKNTDVDCF